MKKTLNNTELNHRANFLAKASEIMLRTCDDGIYDWINATGIIPFEYIHDEENGSEFFGYEIQVDRKVERSEYEEVARNNKRFKTCKKIFRRAIDLYKEDIDEATVRAIMA